jgi:DNA repair protein SbcD/Mre11
MADCHLGGWRDQKLSDLGMDSFEYAIDFAIDKAVDFILISGDLFNTSVPAVDILKKTTLSMARVRKAGIPIYMICGSHDFSPSGKTMIDVIENAGLVKNVVSGTSDDGKIQLDFVVDKSGAKICGMLGKRGTLEKSIYEKLDYLHIEKEEGFKIFMFHSAIGELKPKELAKMDDIPQSYLPKDFNYYAGGHVHYRHIKKTQSGEIVFPGPTFPNNFKELMDLKCGSFAYYDKGVCTLQEINIHPVHVIKIDGHGKDSNYIEREIRLRIKDFSNTIVLIKAYGTMANGKPSDIPFHELIELIYGQGAFFVLKNTTGLISSEFDQVRIKAYNSSDEVEDKLIAEHDLNNKFCSNPKSASKEIIYCLSAVKQEGMTKADYEKKIVDDFDKIIENQLDVKGQN